MTILGAIDLGDRILLGADSAILVQGVLRPAQKVWRSPHMTDVLWGYTGDAGPGRDFKTWFDAQSFSSWGELRDAVIPHLAELNGAARMMSTAARVTREAASVLLCGYLDREPQIIYFGDDGDAIESLWNPLFAGGGSPFADVAWAALARSLPEAELRSEKVFRDVLEVAAEMRIELGPPVTILEARRGGTP